MILLRTFFYYVILMASVIIPGISFASDKINIPILCYHNFNPSVPGSMNMTPEKFEGQLKYLNENGFTIVPLKQVVEYLQGKRDSLPEKPVVITADDGWESVYTYMFPLVKKYNIPVTLFIYPQTISEGKHAMTWDELKELQQTGLFDIQGHTYDHPNFKQTKKHISSEKYEKYVSAQLVDSKRILEEKMGGKITLLAWPFGIYNEGLEKAAERAGYEMAFSIDARDANKSYRAMAQPRFLLVEGQSMKTFARIVNSGN